MSNHARLLSSYRLNKESLIHNDLHLGNILVGIDAVNPEASSSITQAEGMHPTGSLYLIDYEFATVRSFPTFNWGHVTKN